MKINLSTFIPSSVAASISESDAKRLQLTVYFCFTSIIVSIVYTALDLLNSVYYALPFYTAIFVAPLVSLVLLRLHKFLLAKIIVLLGASIAIFWANISDPFETGAVLLFIPLSIVPFAIIGFDYKWTSISIAFITFCLFLIASFGGFSARFAQNPPPYYNQLSLCLNYIISVTISILIVYFLVRLHKLSESSLIEKERAVSEKNVQLTKLNQELDAFVYSVSHDLRSPLSSILGLTNLSKYATTKEELIKYIAMIQERIIVQDAFIKDIIEYSRNTRTELLAESVNLFTLSHDILEGLKYNVENNRIKYQLDIPEDFIIQSDKTRWKTILNNLISNAVKYHDPTKENLFVKIKAVVSGTNIFYSVEDNGMGIESIHHQRIFDMFYRASDSSSGSGLGLFIAKEAVTKLGGEISLISSAGVGSTFKVIIPIQHHVSHG